MSAGRVPSVDIVAERRRQCGKYWPSPRAVVEHSVVPEVLRELPALRAKLEEFDRERDAVREVRLVSGRRAGEVLARNRAAEAEHRVAVQTALEAGAEPPPSPVLKRPPGDGVTPAGFWDDKFASIEAAEFAFIAEHVDDVRHSLAKDVDTASNEVAAAERELIAADRVLTVLTRAGSFLDDLAGKVPEVAPAGGMDQLMPRRASGEAADVQRLFDESRRKPRPRRR